MLGLKLESAYEGQAAMALEATAVETNDTYPWHIDRSVGSLVLDPTPLLAAIAADLRAGADPRRLAFVDGALRALATDCSATGLPVPQIYAARADDETFTVLLSPSRADAPDRWSVHDDGARWEMQRSMLGRGAATGPAAYPALVSLGRDRQGRDVFVDLEAAGGPIQVSGDGVVAGQVITALAVQLATVPWTDGVTVSAFGLPKHVRAIAADRIRVVDNPQDVVRRFGERSGVQGQDVLTLSLIHL